MTAVLDSSALMAYIRDEPGADVVEEVLEDAVISAVNLAEVATKLIRVGGSFSEVEEILVSESVPVIEFAEASAYDCASLWMAGRAIGLSLGDRACLSVAQAYGFDVMTADQVWAQLDIGVTVHVIR